MTAKKKKNDELSDDEKLEYRKKVMEILEQDQNKLENLPEFTLLEKVQTMDTGTLKEELERLKKDREFYKGCLTHGLIHKAGPGSQVYQQTYARLENINAKGKILFHELTTRNQQNQ